MTNCAVETRKYTVSAPFTVPHQGLKPEIQASQEASPTEASRGTGCVQFHADINSSLDVLYFGFPFSERFEPLSTAILPMDATAFGRCELDTTLADRLARIREDLIETTNLAIAEGDRPPTPAAKKGCEELARSILPILSGFDDLAIAVFDEDEGRVSLVVQSLEVDRRVAFEILADGTDVLIVTTDEALNIQRSLFPLSRVDLLEESARWVTGQL